MHIAIIRRRFNPFGGAERFILRTIKCLANHQIKTSIVAEDWHINTIESANDSTCEHIKIQRIKGSRSKQFKHFQKTANNTLENSKFDIIQSHERLVGADIYRLGDGIHAAWVKRLSSIKPWYVRLWLKIDPFHQLLIKTEQSMAKDNRLVFVSNSPMVAKELIDWYQIPQERIVLIENGIDRDIFQPSSASEKLEAKKLIGLNQNIPTVLFVGSGFERKGAFQLVEAMQKLSQFQLIVVGKDKKINQLKKLVSMLNLADRVFIVGAQKDVRPYLSASDIFCLPSLYDSLPNALLEAMCCGLPSVVTQDIGISEKIKDAKAGLISSRDPNDIGAAIKAVWNNYAELSKNALTISKQFDIDAATQKWIALYEKIIEKKILEKECT
jgi:UDP-glucose:(heptosyl)LPS alpha-1,3-glucosyltransferase